MFVLQVDRQIRLTIDDKARNSVPLSPIELVRSQVRKKVDITVVLVIRIKTKRVGKTPPQLNKHPFLLHQRVITERNQLSRFSIRLVQQREQLVTAWLGRYEHRCVPHLIGVYLLHRIRRWRFRGADETRVLPNLALGQAERFFVLRNHTASQTKRPTNGHKYKTGCNSEL